MKKKRNKKSAFKAGMYLLETLTSGMYNDPLSIYREYIQNAADSIDIARLTNKRNSKRIYIDLDPSDKSITIYDKGTGVPADLAEKILCSVGISAKTKNKLRGFRGIGRLGGLAFCDSATFKTKAKGEDVESIQEWNCQRLRQMLSDSSKSSYTLRQLFNKVTNFYQENSKKIKGSYFEVKLHNVQSFRNHIFDIKKVHDYLSMIAPVPFNPNELSFAEEINYYLSANLTNYSQYEIILNGERINKPYRDKIKLSSKGWDHIDRIKLFEILISNKPVAYGWYGERRDLLGAITKGELSSGIRVRDGNIQVGNSHLLDGCFRESRFNSYIIGEIHVDCDDLIPNSRRDDFVDNEYKGLFYNAIEREIGLALSKKIRLSSRLKYKKTNKAPDAQTLTESLKTGHLTGKNLNEQNDKLEKDECIQASNLKEIFKECSDCPKLLKIMNNLANCK